MTGCRQPLAARVWGRTYRTWFPPDVPRQRRKAKRRSARRERQRGKQDGPPGPPDEGS